MKLCVNALKGSTVWSQERSVTAAPNRLWMTDINAGATWDGNLCLASVIDSSGREVVGSSIRNEHAGRTRAGSGGARCWRRGRPGRSTRPPRSSATSARSARYRRDTSQMVMRVGMPTGTTPPALEVKPALPDLDILQRVAT
jgi:hypothetical protein